MIETNLQPLWPSTSLTRSVHNSRKKNRYTIYLAMLGATYIGHSSMSHVHNLMKSPLFTYHGSEGCLVLPLSVAEFDRVCMQFKTPMHFGSLVRTPNPIKLAERMLYIAFIGYRIQRGLCTILGKTSYTLT